MNRSLFKNAWQLIRPYWQSEEKWPAIFRLIIILIFSTVLVRLQVIANDLTKSFYNAIQQFEIKLIIHYVLLYLLVMVIFATLTAFQGYIFGVLANRWRRWLTQNFVADWLKNKAYYQMNITGNGVDNPDQRISEDIDSLTTVTLTLVAGLYTALFQLGTFTLLLWQIGGALNFHFSGHAFHVPGYLFWCVLSYAIFNTLVTMLIGRRLAPLNYQQQHYNADFRFGLMRLREYGEQIALFRGEKNEEARLHKTYQPVFSNYLKILGVARNLTLFSEGTDLLSMMLGILFALPIFIQTHATIGALMQMSSLVGYEYNALSFIISAYATIASWRAIIARLTEFSEKIERSEIASTNSALKSSAGERLHIQELNIFLPDQKNLQKNMKLEIHPGERVLITGPSGSGKSTLLRIIAGLWPFASGEITTPKENKMFLSQKPYLPPVSLIEAICFPETPEAFEPLLPDLKNYLKELELDKLIPQLHETQNWHQSLSLGEQQRLAIIRALLHRPAWLFLDEATASLDEALEDKVYKLIEKVLPDTTIVSIGHRKSLLNHHKRTLDFSSL